MDTSDIITLLILFIIFIIVLYLAFVSKTEVIINTSNKEPKKINEINGFDKYYNYSDDDDDKSIKNIEINNEGYIDETMKITDDLKQGDYINQFKEIDFEKMPKSNNQIGFNPKPKDDKYELPYANVNVEYLLSK
jgi:archaellum component FlaF (FlaF/FlaG flagellin family)